MDKPIAISTEQANHVRALIDEATRKDNQSLETATARIVERLSGIQEKLNKLTRGYIDRTHLNLRLFNRRLIRLILGVFQKT
jgi:hypothetical protein